MLATCAAMLARNQCGGTGQRQIYNGCCGAILNYAARHPFVLSIALLQNNNNSTSTGRNASMRSGTSRRTVLKTAALASAAVITAPYVRGAYAAGNLSLGCWDHWVPGANKALTKLCNEWGDEEQSRSSNRLHHLARREGQAHRRRRSASRHRSRHHVASRLEHPHPPGAARAARRRHRRADQEIRPDQPGRRISRQEQRRVARRSDRSRQPGQAVLLALRSLQGACRHRSAGHVPGRRVEMEQGQDRQMDLGSLSRLGAEAAQGRLPGRLADGADLRCGRLGRRPVQRLWRRVHRRQGQHQDQFRPDAAGHGNGPQDHGSQPARSVTPGTTPATIAG